jgi:hypothetical protein
MARESGWGAMPRSQGLGPELKLRLGAIAELEVRARDQCWGQGLGPELGGRARGQSWGQELMATAMG